MKQILSLAMLVVVNFCIAQDITTFPYFAGFEGVEGTLNELFPAGWVAEDLNQNPTGNQGWRIIKETPLGDNAHTDSTAVHMFSHANEANNDWLFTPSVQMEAGHTYTLSFWYKAVVMATSEKLKVHVGTANNGTDMATTTAIWENTNITNDSWVEATTEFTPNNSDIYYFGFHYYSEAWQFMLIVDDITIDREENVGITKVNHMDYSFTQTENGLRFSLGEPLNSKASGAIFTLDGKTIEQLSFPATSSNLEVNTQQLKNGCYLIKCYSDDQKLHVSDKFFIAR